MLLLQHQYLKSAVYLVESQTERRIIIKRRIRLFLTLNAIPNAANRASSVWNDNQIHTRMRNWCKKRKNSRN